MSSYYTLLPPVLGRTLTAADAISPTRLDDCEARLGFALPDRMRALYLTAGAAPELQVHNSLRMPETLQVEDGYLIFMEENQNVVDWGIRVPSADSDPEVWQRVNADPPEYHSENKTFSAFIVGNLAFVRGVD